MANEKNLMPIQEVNARRTREQRSADSRKAGQASGKARREQKAIREILTDYLSNDIKDNKQLENLAKKLNIDSKKSIKELFAVVCVLNSLKQGKLDDLEKMARLLGEEEKPKENNGILDELAEYLKNDKTDVE